VTVRATQTTPGRSAKPFLKAPKPKISGTAKVGSTLVARAGTWKPKPKKLSYQWLAGGKPIKGATKSKFAVKAAQVGKTIKVRVTAVKSGYLKTKVTSKATAVVKAASGPGAQKPGAQKSTASPIQVTGASLNKEMLSLAVGATETLLATVVPPTATNRAVTWSSSNASVATVTSSGVVRGVAAGPAKITATTADGGKEASAMVTVSSPSQSIPYEGLLVGTWRNFVKNTATLLTYESKYVFGKDGTFSFELLRGGTLKKSGRWHTVENDASRDDDDELCFASVTSSGTGSGGPTNGCTTAFVVWDHLKYLDISGIRYVTSVSDRHFPGTWITANRSAQYVFENNGTFKYTSGSTTKTGSWKVNTPSEDPDKDELCFSNVTPNTGSLPYNTCTTSFITGFGWANSLLGLPAQDYDNLTIGGVVFFPPSVVPGASMGNTPVSYENYLRGNFQWTDGWMFTDQYAFGGDGTFQFASSCFAGLYGTCTYYQWIVRVGGWYTDVGPTSSDQDDLLCFVNVIESQDWVQKNRGSWCTTDWAVDGNAFRLYGKVYRRL